VYNPAFFVEKTLISCFYQGIKPGKNISISAKHGDKMAFFGD
jgi:hypothetical protein